MSGCVVLFFFKQKTAYEMRISDWSSDACSSDLFEIQFARLVLCRYRGQRSGEQHRKQNEIELGHIELRHRGSCGDAQYCAARTRVALSSEERRVGQDGVSTFRSWWSLFH